MYDFVNKESYIGRHVKIKSSYKTVYNKIIGKTGVVTKQSGGSIGVTIDGEYNKASAHGVYWFEKSELKFLNDESEDIKMTGFGYVAVVNLLDDYNKKDYAFALYENDYNNLCNYYNPPVVASAMVVVNARGENNRLIGTVKKVFTVDEYCSSHKNVNITAEVVGVVDMCNYIAREAEKTRLAELAKKKAAIEKELEAEINKRKSIEYYEAMAKEYSDNPKLAELVAELKGLGA